MFKGEKTTMRKICPRCQTADLKGWNELDSDEKFIFERLPPSAKFSAEERRRHLFCPRCHFEARADEDRA